MKEPDWSQFYRRIAINVEKDKIFDYWTSQENIEKWFLSKAEFADRDGHTRSRNDTIQPKDKYIWMWHGSDSVAEGEVLANNGKDTIKFTFLGCKVSVNIATENGHNLVILYQYNIPTDDLSRMGLYVECTRGWTFYMANLKSILEGGLDLRNKTMDLSAVINS